MLSCLDEYVFDALSAGAAGFLLKHARPEELLFGIGAGAMVAPELGLRDRAGHPRR